jgi:AcrR family transcriptional regulator
MRESQRKIRKEQTRVHLIMVSLTELAKEGLVSTTTASIAQAAGVSHGTVFVHFPTRDALLSAVIEEFGNRVIPRLHELISSGGGVRDILEAHIQGLTEFESFYTRLVMERHLLPENAKNVLLMIQTAISFHLTQAAESEMAKGKIRRIPLHLLFNTWLGLVHHYLSNSDLFAPDGPILPRYGRELLEHYMNLISI